MSFSSNFLIQKFGSPINSFDSAIFTFVNRLPFWITKESLSSLAFNASDLIGYVDFLSKQNFFSNHLNFGDESFSYTFSAKIRLVLVTVEWVLKILPALCWVARRYLPLISIFLLAKGKADLSSNIWLFLFLARNRSWINELRSDEMIFYLPLSLLYKSYLFHLSIYACLLLVNVED